MCLTFCTVKRRNRFRGPSPESDASHLDLLAPLIHGTGTLLLPEAARPLLLEQRAGEGAPSPSARQPPTPGSPAGRAPHVSPLSFSRPPFRSQAGGGQCVAAALLNPQLAGKQRVLNRSEGTFCLASCRLVASGQGTVWAQTRRPWSGRPAWRGLCALPLLQTFLRLAPPLRLCGGQDPLEGLLWPGGPAWQFGLHPRKDWAGTAVISCILRVPWLQGGGQLGRSGQGAPR